MSLAQFDHVTVETLADLSYDGYCSSRTLLFDDGRKKMLCIVLPCQPDIKGYELTTQTSERVEIVAGECEVQVNGEPEASYYRPGQSFMVSGDSGFVIRSQQVVQFIRHLEG